MWGEKKTTYIKGSYRYPIVSDDDIRTVNPTRLEQAKANKIIIAGMSSCIEAIYDDGKCLAGKSTIIILDDDGQRLLTLIGILNSKLISFYVNHFYRSLKMAGGYINIGKEIINSIPLPNCEPNTSISQLVTKIIERRTHNVFAPIVDLEKQIDALVYQIYGLTHDEIATVEGPTAPF
ncbi:MAG: hypothetical protein LLF76_15315 [Planctomycetaceae bacterium]|nr:hypothetical protein [Planctomycetaceae bacterium]